MARTRSDRVPISGRELLAYGIAGVSLALAGGATLAVLATPEPSPTVRVIEITTPDAGCAEYASQLEAYAEDMTETAEVLVGFWDLGVPFDAHSVRGGNLIPMSERLDYLSRTFGPGCTF